MKWFKEKELACKCCGQLPPLVRENMVTLVHEVLDPARDKLGEPIVVNSGYRCQKHNKAVGGVANSQHTKGEAADVSAGSTQANKKLLKLLIEGQKYDQLIIYPTFLHVSWKRVGQNRRMVLEKTANGYRRVAL
jgi:hypothetical protein